MFSLIPYCRWWTLLKMENTCLALATLFLLTLHIALPRWYYRAWNVYTSYWQVSINLIELSTDIQRKISVADIENAIFLFCATSILCLLHENLLTALYILNVDIPRYELCIGQYVSTEQVLTRFNLHIHYMALKRNVTPTTNLFPIAPDRGPLLDFS